MKTTTLETIHIVLTPDVLSGKPRIDGHRISVQQVAEYCVQGSMSADVFADSYGLDLSEVHAALSYYHAHREEIDADIQTEADWAEQIKAALESSDVLDQVITAPAVALEYKVTPHAVRDAIRHGWIEARKVGGTWLIRRKDAQARWGTPS
jgi:uncharacterized protein (DUF433 family)